MQAEPLGCLRVIAIGLAYSAGDKVLLELLYGLVELSKGDRIGRAAFEQVLRQIFRKNRIAAAHHDAALHGVLQLANIAGPVVLPQQLVRGRGGPEDSPVHSLRVLRHKMAGKQGDVFRAFAQRRHTDREDIQAEEQILPERPVPDRLLQVPIGGSNDADTHLQSGRAANSFEFVILKDSKQSTLRLVLNPDPIAIAETRRTYTCLALFGFPMDAIIVNKVLPGEAAEGFLQDTYKRQQRYMEEIGDVFLDTTILTARPP